MSNKTGVVLPTYALLFTVTQQISILCCLTQQIRVYFVVSLSKARISLLFGSLLLTVTLQINIGYSAGYGRLPVLLSFFCDCSQNFDILIVRMRKKPSVSNLRPSELSRSSAGCFLSELQLCELETADDKL